MSSKSAVSDREKLESPKYFGFLERFRLSNAACARCIMYLYESQRGIHKPDCVAARLKVLADFLCCVLRQIRWRNNLNSQSRCAFNRRMVGIDVP